jgi:acyl carrier protein
MDGGSAGGAVAARDERALLDVVARTLHELHVGAPGGPAVAPAVAPTSVLDRDLGFDSLARVELLLRIERAFDVALPEDTLQRAETVADLWEAVRRGRAAHAAPAGGVAEVAAAGAAGAAAPPAVAATTPEPADPADPAASATTLLEALDAHVRAHPDRVQLTHLADDGATPLTSAQLAAQAAAVAAGLRRAGLQPRQTVAIMLPNSTAYFAVCLGILRAGSIPVPIYPPARASQLEDRVLRDTGILANAGAVLMVTPPEAHAVARLLAPAELLATEGAPAPVAVHADDIAFTQYTSGSTGQPKGVVLTHANLLANIRAMAQAVQATPRDVFVSWLPLYHDVGLIGAWLGC